MKKILYIVLMVTTVFSLMACATTGVELHFDVKASFTYVIGDDYPDYTDGLIAHLSDDTDLTDEVEIDDAGVNYEVSGQYQVVYRLTYDTVLHSKTSTVQVVSSQTSIIDFNFYYLNDLHGAILEHQSSMGLAKIGNLIIDEKENNPDTTLFLSGGDMLQGQIISNWYDGASVIDLLNDMQLDAFVIGNHEFDWGIDVVTQYFNGANEMQANFPFLGANVYAEATNGLMDDIEPYTIIEKSGVKIAVIGLMGYGLESSISFTRVEDYYFVDPVERTGYWAEYVRVHEGADIVVAVNHHDSSFYNGQVAAFTGNKQIDAIFNGHTHQAYVRETNTSHGLVHTIQSGANGTGVGKITLTYNTESGVVGSQGIVLNQSNESRLNVAHPDLAEKIAGYSDEIANLYESIITSGAYYSQSDLAYYIAQLMQLYTGADVGIHNFGGTRAPIQNNEEISYAKLFQISPFDNTVVLTTVSGSVLLNAISNQAVSFKSGLSAGNINPSGQYVIATNDYIFGGSSSLKAGSNITYTGVSVLDVFAEVVENQAVAGASKWYTMLPIVFNSDLSLKLVAIIPDYRIYV